MKKTISINISGVVFNIEEDAYEKLHGYLESIKKYFSSYESNVEIVADIENRIAEKFFNKLKTENKQALAVEDVNQLVASMGSVSDFEAIEEEEDLKATSTRGTEAQSGEPTNLQSQFSNPKSPIRLYRDTKRKVFAGVCGGLAHYLNFDVVWIRLVFLLLFFLPAPLNEAFAGVSAFVFLGYIAYWVAFPPNDNLEYDIKVKKFYRDVENKAVGGVAAGLAAYFGLDRGIIRFLFVVAFFGFGIGFMVYLLLWIAAPKAESLTQKMEMKGEPVTLTNIEENVKQSLNIDPNQPENTFAKLVLLPFRFVAVVVEFIGKLLKNVFPFVRVFIGGLLMLTGLLGLLTVGIAVVALLGIVEGQMITSDIEFFNFVTQEVPTQGILATAVVIGSPLLLLMLTGLWLIKPSNWGLNITNLIIGVSIWFLALSVAGKYITELKMKFNRKGEHFQEKTFAVGNKTPLFDLKEISNDQHRPDIELEGYDGTDIKVAMTFSAKGSRSSEAEETAKKITYNISQKDSVLVFDSEIALPENAKFREQDLDIKLMLPYDKVFSVTADFHDEFESSIFDQWWGEDTMWENPEKVKQYRFVMKRGEGLTCLNCPKQEEQNVELQQKEELPVTSKRKYD